MPIIYSIKEKSSLLANQNISVDEIKTISIIEIAKRLDIDIKHKKAECYNGHDSKTKSLSFSEKKGLFYCFGCDEGGDQIQLVRKVLNLSFKDSCHWIQSEFNLTPPVYIQGRLYRKKAKSIIRKQTNPKSPYKSNPEIYEWLMDLLSLSQKSKNYLVNSRGFSEEIIERIGIKDIVNPTTVFVELNKKWGIERLLECGLAKINKTTNKSKFVWWDDTIVFPFWNLQDRIEYLQGRRLKSKEPKYVNIMGVEPILFNLNSLSQLPENEKVFICEGVTDSISAMEKNLNVIGVLGANGFKEKWTRFLLDYEIIVIPDADQGGDKFVKSVTRHFKTIGKPIRHLVLPKGKDLNDLINEK